jgi:hypothetical protein
MRPRGSPEEEEDVCVCEFESILVTVCLLGELTRTPDGDVKEDPASSGALERFLGRRSK